MWSASCNFLIEKSAHQHAKLDDFISYWTHFMRTHQLASLLFKVLMVNCSLLIVAYYQYYKLLLVILPYLIREQIKSSSLVAGNHLDYIAAPLFQSSFQQQQKNHLLLHIQIIRHHLFAKHQKFRTHYWQAEYEI